MASRRVPTLAPLVLMEQLDDTERWRLDLQRTPEGGRVWKVFLDEEPAPRVIVREP